MSYTLYNPKQTIFNSILTPSNEKENINSSHANVPKNYMC